VKCRWKLLDVILKGADILSKTLCTFSLCPNRFDILIARKSKIMLHFFKKYVKIIKKGENGLIIVKIEINGRNHPY